MPEGEPSHAEMIAAMRSLIEETEVTSAGFRRWVMASDKDNFACLRAVLLHLQRTQWRDIKAKDAEIAALKSELDAATATFDDEQVAHQDTFRLWQQARTLMDAAIIAAAEATEQRDRAMAVVEAAQAWAIDRHATLTSAFFPSETRLFNAVVGFNSLDAEAAAETERT